MIAEQNFIQSRETPDARDERLMRLAIAYGERNLGRTWPNPSVGAIIVREIEGVPVIIAEAVTYPGGRPHAEPQALRQAREAARGATLYVSLEPCAHHGKAPPCAEAVIAAGISRVVIAVNDPDPRVAGQGCAMLRAAGITVTENVLSELAQRAHRGHFCRVRHKRPFVTLKLAQTADGFAGGEGGTRLHISSAMALAWMHMLRAHADAIVIGIGTVLADNPQLTTRLPGITHHSPVRVVIDSRLDLPLDSHLVTTCREVPVWVVTCTPDRAKANALRAAGIEVIDAEQGHDGRVDLPSALRALAEKGITRIFSEGGPRLAAALAEADLIDQAILATAPTVYGGNGIPAALPPLRQALGARFTLWRRERAGVDDISIFERPL